MDLMLLMRLRDLGVSSRLGMADRMFPDCMSQLASGGYAAEASGGGYRITDAGVACLAARREELKTL